MTVLTIDTADRAFLWFYRHAQRLSRLVLAFLPLMVLLVGSCKTSQLSWIYGKDMRPEQIRAALFPEADADHPSAGYIARAQALVAAAPDVLKVLTQREIGYLFGKPALLRRDADAEVWQYQGEACVVDFYFYGTRQTAGQSPLAYADFRAKGQAAQDAQPLPPRQQAECLRRVHS